MNEVVSAQVSGEPLPQWPAPAGKRVVLILDCNTPTERGVVERWAAQARPSGTTAEQVTFLAIPAKFDDARVYTG